MLAAGDYPLDAVPEDEGSILSIGETRNVTLCGVGDKTRLVVRDHVLNKSGYFRKVISVHNTDNFVMRDFSIDFAPGARDWLQGVARDVTMTAAGTAAFTFEMDKASPPLRSDAFATPDSFCMGIAINQYGQPREGFPDFFTVAKIHPAYGALQITTGPWSGVDCRKFLEGQRILIIRRKPGESLFCFSGSNVHPVLRNIQVMASRGMMIEAYGCDRLELDHLDMRPAAGQWLVSPGDGLHYQGGVRGPYVHGSHFEALGDDAIHIYAKPFKVAAGGEAGTLKYDAASIALEAGQRLWIYANASPGGGQLVRIAELKGDIIHCDAGFKAGLIRIQKISRAMAIEKKNACLLSGLPHTPPPAPVGRTPKGEAKRGLRHDARGIFWKGMIPDRAINLSRSGSDFIIRDNTFGPLRGIGCRLSAGEGVVEGNVFTRVGGSAVSFECGLGKDYDEGPFPYNIVVKHNHFDDCAATQGYSRQAVRFVAPWDIHSQRNELPFSHLQVLDNSVAGGSTVSGAP
jgi:hypothetical protein